MASFSPGPTLQTKRSLLTAAPLPDGNILVIGGYDGSNRLNTTEIYNPQSVSQGFICEIINKRANTCDPTIEEYVYSSRSSMIWCLGLVWSACAYRVPCLPKLVLF